MEDKKICKLCEKNEASGIKSHAIPKFMTKNIKESDGENKVYYLDINTGKYQAKQDFHKEKYLFCIDCEEYLSKEYEVRFARLIHNPWTELQLAGSNVKVLNRGIRGEKLVSFFGNANIESEYVFIKRFIYHIILRMRLTEYSRDLNLIFSKYSEDILRAVTLNKQKFLDIPMFSFILHPTNTELIHIRELKGLGLYIQISFYIFILTHQDFIQTFPSSFRYAYNYRMDEFRFGYIPEKSAIEYVKGLTKIYAKVKKRSYSIEDHDIVDNLSSALKISKK